MSLSFKQAKNIANTRKDILVTKEETTISDCLFQELYFEEDHLVSGSLEALVEHMVPDKLHFPDRAFLFAFLLGSRLFIRPHDLLGQVLAVCDSQQKAYQKQMGAKVIIYPKNAPLLRM